MANGHCSTCEVEKECAYEYKPCDCCDQRKFTPMMNEPVLEDDYPVYWG